MKGNLDVLRHGETDVRYCFSGGANFIEAPEDISKSRDPIQEPRCGDWLEIVHGEVRACALVRRLTRRKVYYYEALSFTLNRISQSDINAVFEYHERRRRRGRLSRKRLEIPKVIERQLVPEIIQCLHYFCCRQSRLLIRLHDSAYLCRELMFLNDPQTEGVLHWLVHLTLGMLHPTQELDIDEEVKQLKVIREMGLIEELCDLLKEEATA